MLHDVSLRTNFILKTIFITILDGFAREVLFSSTVLKNKLSICLNWASDQWWFETVAREDLPDSVIDRLGVEANLLISRVSCENLRCALLRMQVQVLAKEVRSCYKSNFLAICDHISWMLFRFNFLDGEDGPCARSNISGGSCASVCFIAASDLIPKIKHQETIRCLVH